VQIGNRSWQSKLARARHHLDDFALQAASLEEASRRNVVAERDGDDLVLVVRGTPVVGEDLLLTAADALHNARTALDHVICDLASQGRGALGRPPAEAEERKLQFPVLDDAERWPKARDSLAPFLSESVLDVLELEQPFRVVEFAALMAEPPLTDRESIVQAALPSVRRLNKLDVVDKHRRLNVAMWYPGSVGDSSIGPRGTLEGQEFERVEFDDLPEQLKAALQAPPNPSDSDFYFTPGPVVDGAELGRWIRNDRAGPVGDVTRTAKLRLVIIEDGLTAIGEGAPPAADAIRTLIDDAEAACCELWNADSTREDGGRSTANVT
jgi:hypothetical protein